MPESSNKTNAGVGASHASQSSQNSYVLQETDAISVATFASEQTFSVADGAHSMFKQDGGTHSKSWPAKFAQPIVNSRQFKRVVISLIVLNAIFMGVATSDIVSDNSVLHAIFEVKNIVFLLLFTIELVLQLMYHQLQLFYDGWLLFDFLVITLSWVTSYLLMLRTFRLVRTLRLASRVEDLRNLAISLIDSVPKVIALGFLMVLMFFIFSVVFTDMFKDLYTDGITSEDYFSRLDRTLFTLFQIMTLDGWSKIAKEVMIEKPWAWFPFVTFVIVSSYFFLNLIIAVVCESVFKVQSLPKAVHGDAKMMEALTEDIIRLEHKIDALTSLVAKVLGGQQLLPAQQKRKVAPGVIT